MRDRVGSEADSKEGKGECGAGTGAAEASQFHLAMPHK